MYPLEIEHVTKRYGREVVVDDLTFTVAPGRVTCFLGPNGAGKSTTMKILLDLAKADHGLATIGGSRYRAITDPVRRVGVVLEPNAFHPGRSGRHHLRVLTDGAGKTTTLRILLGLVHANSGQATILGKRYSQLERPFCQVGAVLEASGFHPGRKARNHLRVLARAGCAPEKRVDEVLATVGLEGAAKKRVGGYSLGMRQRLGLAAALLGDPPVLLLDEPGNGLDPQGIRWLRDLLRERAAAGGTVFVSSHLLTEVEHLADEVVVISHGQLVASGALASLQDGGTSVRTPEPERLTQLLLRSAGATVHTGVDGDLVVRGVAIAEIGDCARDAGIALHELTSQAGSLEDLFLSLTSSDSTPVNGADSADATVTERQAVLR